MHPAATSAMAARRRAASAPTRSRSRAARRGAAEQRPRPGPPGEHCVELGAVDGHLRAEVQPGEDAEHQGKRAIGAAGVLDVFDIEATKNLQGLPEERG